jgi:protocatechuate 3,4-dioxygenase beta subunit
MNMDDHATGRILTRREALALLGGAAMLAGGVTPRHGIAQTLPSCIVTPEQTEGPYFTDVRLNRSDIRSDPTDKSVKEGLPLTLTLRVSAVGGSGCAPLAGAMVDVWHCDAAGVYSDSDGHTAGKKFLRGHQMTDASGAVRFTTIYPGWYPGRAVHIHFKVRIIKGPALGSEMTSQLYFDDAVNERVIARAPYTTHGRRIQKNQEDGLFRHNGSRLMLALTEAGPGYAGEFHVGLKTA